MRTEEVVKLLRKIVERGYIPIDELSSDELEIIKQLEKEGVVKKCYTISPEYIQDVVKLCKPRVITVRHGGNRNILLKIIKILIPTGFTILPMYLAIESILLGPDYLGVAIFFILISAACLYAGSIVSRKIIERLRLLKL